MSSTSNKAGNTKERKKKLHTSIHQATNSICRRGKERCEGETGVMAWVERRGGIWESGCNSRDGWCFFILGISWIERASWACLHIYCTSSYRAGWGCGMRRRGYRDTKPGGLYLCFFLGGRKPIITGHDISQSKCCICFAIPYNDFPYGQNTTLSPSQMSRPCAIGIFFAFPFTSDPPVHMGTTTYLSLYQKIRD